MFPLRTSESHPFSTFPQYLYTSTTSCELGATLERNEAPNLFVTENMNYCCYHDPLVNNGNNVILPSRVVQPAVVKKDKHTKILTSRGPRDRRVRLSIDVSKKFFGLQDMLGFDKASKTLDWLFTKSKLAIEELAQMKIRAKGGQETSLDGRLVEKNAREIRRAHARARARERTRRNQTLSLRSKCTTSTNIKVDVEKDTQFSNNEELGHGGLLLPCTTTGNKWDLSSLVPSMNTDQQVFQLSGESFWEVGAINYEL